MKGNETELSLFDRQAYDAFKRNPEVRRYPTMLMTGQMGLTIIYMISLHVGDIRNQSSRSRKVLVLVLVVLVLATPRSLSLGSRHLLSHIVDARRAHSGEIHRH